MADSGAWYGLVGAIGGALIGGGAAIFGPLLLHGRGARDQKQRDGDARRIAELERVVQMRSTMDACVEILMQMVQNLKYRRIPEVNEFDERFYPARREAIDALNAAIHDGLWVTGTGSVGRRGAPRSPGPDDQGTDLFLNALAEAHKEIRKCALLSVQPTAAELDQLEVLVRRVMEARVHLSAQLFARVESIMGDRFQAS
ncbi:hypothetical protein ACWCPF_34545 [Streptomyces sp. NPDC001858]